MASAESGDRSSRGWRQSVAGIGVGVGEGENVKVVVVGDGAVGKTSLLVSYVMDRFPTDHVPTVFANYAKEAVVCGERVNLWLCDTAGQEEYDRLRVMAYPDTDVFLLCYSVTDPKSLNSITEKWLPEVRFHCPTAQFLLVATKMDLRNSEQEMARLAKEGQKPVTEADGQQVAKDEKVDGFMECSALTQDNLAELFDFAARLALTSSKKQSGPERAQSRVANFFRSRCRFL